jgi:hypothetical protein
MKNSRKSLGLGSLLILSLMLGACSSAPSQNGEPATEQNMQEMQEATEGMGDSMEGMEGMAMNEGIPSDLDTATTRTSEQGIYQVSITSNLDPVDINQIHSWTLHVETPEGQPVEHAEIVVNGGMPQHNHGFPTSPQVTQELGDGEYLVEGVKFNMAGWWEMTFAITANGQSDSITFNIVLQ